MGLDYGEQTVGVAISDATGTIAVRKETIRRDSENQLRATFRRLEELCSEHEIDRIVLGLPLHLDGRMSPRAEKTMAFQARLEKRLHLPVILQDERLSSAEAEEILRLHGVPRKDWKAEIDNIAAEIILQDFLNQSACRSDAAPSENNKCRN